MFQALIEHIKTSFNGGIIQPIITVFRKREGGKGDMRVWNPLMLMFAGYGYANERGVDNKPDGSMHGDQINNGFTKVSQKNWSAFVIHGYPSFEVYILPTLPNANVVIMSYLGNS